MKYDILIAGVGGQGVVLASRLLALAAMKAGFHVSTAETIRNGWLYTGDLG
ncbi:MAG TPA: 2-oxoacid:acceptor oxidoreductase family protein, partial [Methanosarcina vacuolata]|nr:2-oxoacid:acceptor oxidoreductase family protein [Methanosarcina vacuolata]